MTQANTNLSSLSNSTSFNGLLKDVYLPALTDATFNDTSFTALIESTTENVDYEGQRIIKGFKYQRAGGHGAFSEGGNYVSSVPAKGIQGSESIKFLNALFEITGPAILAAQSPRGSFINATEQAFSDMMTNAKNDMERILMGSGTGVIGATDATADMDVSEYADNFTYTIATGGGFTKTQFFRPGQLLNIHNDTLGTEVTTDGTTPMVFTVVSVTPTTVTVSCPSAPNGSDIANKTLYFTNAGAYSGTTCLEPNGLQLLVGTGRSVWGLADSSYAWLQSYVQATVGQALDEELLLTWLLTLQYQYQANPNLMVVDPRAMLQYFMSVKDERRFNTTSGLNFTGGVQGMGIQLGSKTLMLTTLGTVTPGNLYMINTSDFKFATMTNGYQWVNGGQGVLQQREGSDNKFAAAVNYMNFVCYDPGRQFKATGITYN